MAGAGVGELIWLALAVLLGLVVVIAWIVKAESGRNFFRAELKKMNLRLEEAERDKMMMIEEMNAIKDNAGASAEAQASSTTGVDSATIGKMVERVEGLEKDNNRLKKELNEARNSLEEVYKALCSK